MLVAQQLKHLHGLEFAFLLALCLRLLVKFWGCKERLLLWDVNGCTDTLMIISKGDGHESKPSAACTLSLITEVCRTTVPLTLLALQESVPSLHRIDSISSAHNITNGSCCPLLGSAVKSSLQKASHLFLTFPFNHGFQHFILLLFSERKNGKEVRNSALKTAAVLFKSREPPT